MRRFVMFVIFAEKFLIPVFRVGPPRAPEGDIARDLTSLPVKGVVEVTKKANRRRKLV